MTSSPRLVEAGELTPQSRGSAAVVEVLDPRPGEHVLDLCAGPGIKTGQIAARMGDRGEMISVELEPGRAAEVAGQARRLGPAQRHRDRGRRGRDGDGARLRPGPGRRALLGPRRARLAARRPLAQVAGGDRAAGRAAGAGSCAGRPLSCARAGSSSTRPARSPGARTRTGSRRCSTQPPRARSRRSRSRTSALARPALASPVDPALPAAAPGPRSHDRILHRPPETGCHLNRHD